MILRENTLHDLNIDALSKYLNQEIYDSSAVARYSRFILLLLTFMLKTCKTISCIELYQRYPKSLLQRANIHFRSKSLQMFCLIMKGVRATTYDGL